MLKKSQKMYKNKKYYTRKSLASYKNKTSKHIINAQKIYGINKVVPSKELVKATGCSLEALKKIVKKAMTTHLRLVWPNLFKVPAVLALRLLVLREHLAAWVYWSF